MLFSANNLACNRGASLLVDNLTFAVAPGEAVWLTGPNGVGKSTLLRVLAGVQPPLRGMVSIESDFIYQPSEAGFDAGSTVVANLEWWAVVHKAYVRPIADALAFWQLSAQANQTYASLSQGQRQRVALARLSLSSAWLWLLDEPLAHLDAEGEALFRDALQAHLARGGAIVAATHNTSLLPQARIIALGQNNV